LQPERDAALVEEVVAAGFVDALIGSHVVEANLTWLPFLLAHEVPPALVAGFWDHQSAA